MSIFKENGYDEQKIEVIRAECNQRFEVPTPQQLQAYSTEIVTAVRTNNLDRVKQLYHEGIYNCNACNRFGESILHIACRRGHVAMVEFFLVTCGFQLNVIRDDYFRTPFHDAFWTSKASTTLIDFLLTQQQTQPNNSSLVALLLLKDKRGNTPLDYSRLEDHPIWIQFLQERETFIIYLRIPIFCRSRILNTHIIKKIQV
ncbi:hypothetical protein FRACYDRAFT_196332 [Fragilariopsis cylindrus CCMP1102]|uniref:Uncharacterized protein n=1 Tax=Fragilariopsis cylindrus CCMP1102 TaxID=635003 RepID=A0A1E7ERU7_9STRA|nr:hypothetical protein FRACYDRAFT_196332 [Fragilariopsis cylindrus CCMP1102]|eukprot:OEU08557.1 hypothetical protein FRACYDRAFT_196332 [Fragilariopsis cylindrus CCMP1102]